MLKHLAVWRDSGNAFGGFLAARPLATWKIILIALCAGLSCATDLGSVFGAADATVNPWHLARTATFLVLLSIGPVLSAAGSWLGALMVLLGAGLQLFEPVPLFAMLLLVITTFIVAMTATKAFSRTMGALAALWMLANTVFVGDDALFLTGFLPTLLLAYAIGRRIAVLNLENTESKFALAANAAAQQKALMAERRGIARDLHDIVAHDITIVAMQADVARLSCTQQDVQDSLLAISEASRQALNDMRTMLQVLASTGPQAESEPIAVSDKVLAVEIEDAVLTLESAGFVVSRTVCAQFQAIPRSTQVGLAPVVRESITNILKYAKRGMNNDVVLRLTETQEEVRWEISNVIADATAATAISSGGFGLIGLRERMQLLGGSFSTGVKDGRWGLSAVLLKRAGRPSQ